MRRHLHGQPLVPPLADDVAGALDTLVRFRAQHALPLTKANMGLRSVIRTERCARVEVSQRLKRVPTILDKLQREPTLALANMQDIGGCRAVLASMDEVRRVQARLTKNRPPVSVSDDIAAPRSSGYRGVHVIVRYEGGGVERRIEIQLRTQAGHDRAVTVERLSGRLGQNLKGDGTTRRARAPGRSLTGHGARGGRHAGRCFTVGRVVRLRTRAAPYLGGSRS